MWILFIGCLLSVSIATSTTPTKGEKRQEIRPETRPETPFDHPEDVDHTMATVRVHAHFDAIDPTQSHLEFIVNPKERAIFVSVFQDNITIANTNMEYLSQYIIEKAKVKDKDIPSPNVHLTPIPLDHFPWVFPLGLNTTKVNRILEEFVILDKSIGEWNSGAINDTSLIDKMQGLDTLISFFVDDKPPEFLRTLKLSRHIKCNEAVCICIYLLF